MVQKRDKPPSPAPAPLPRRGRPRAFAPDVALAKAMDLFRDGGFAATSLDDLSAAMGINRPSLYGTFGDKRALFLKAYERYCEETRALFTPAFDPEIPLRAMLERVFATAIDLYLEGENGPRGCFTVMTAGSEAMADPEIRDLVQAGVQNTDRAFADRFRLAQRKGELSKTCEAEMLARLTTAAIQSIAIRARARAPREELEAMAKGVIGVVCGDGREGRA